ncbi:MULTISPECIES: glutaredoxin-like protein NrdH [Enterococcus]|uniref:Glutaredoxin-like protein NrdH n=1 Tax=Enterococcus alishanensis TaxID=1303817 RepID=A0ABS6T8Z1_9ENTE|nr:glutaredoxin-like protein NrdH [Enterococcus alishanensis]MBV7389369.1 glutaredoxin-like protein NrdH [Enterococcus alishanensis]
MVKVYSKNNCMQCKMTKRYLNDNHISFEEINIDSEPTALDFLKEQGFQSVPVTFNGSDTIIGFRPDQLKALA